MLEFFLKIPNTFYVALFVSFLICLIIISTKELHGYLTSDSFKGIQKLHKKPTPRVGGIGVFIGVVLAYFFESNERSTILGPIILAGLSAFLIGLIEDLTKKINITTRLLATILSGIVGWIITGISLTHIGLLLMDPLFKHQWFSVVFTAIAIGGIANAINIIDGLNGLASSVMIISLVTISMIAYSVGDKQLSNASLTVGAAIFGFFLLNWPCGKLFLGDGGSYFGGFALGWICVLLIERNHTVAPFAGLLVAIYPFTEVLFSIYRRRIKNNDSTKPDLQHLHSLIYRRYIRTNKLHTKENSFAGLIVGAFSIPPCIGAFIFKENNFICSVLALLYALSYAAVYFGIIRFKFRKLVKFN